MWRRKIIMIPLLFLSLLLMGSCGLYGLTRSSFGELPEDGAYAQSPQWRDGKFRNAEETQLMAEGVTMMSAFRKGLFGKKGEKVPRETLSGQKHPLRAQDRAQDHLVGLGHSSLYLQLCGKRILIDPVLGEYAAPLSCFNRAFKRSQNYEAADIPDIDLLLISHDHWDHLDHRTVYKRQERITKVSCPRGGGQHVERGGYEVSQMVEVEWEQSVELEGGVEVWCLPARHFSGRTFKANQTLWASFMIVSPRQNIYVSGDTGYDTHFAQIGEQFEKIDFTICETGQYNEEWRYIHMMPEFLAQAIRDINPHRAMTGHHSKYALSKHPWDEPLNNVVEIIKHDSLPLTQPRIGEFVRL